MAKLGTLEWVEDTNGRLGFFDKLRMIADGVRAKAATQKSIKSGAKVRYADADDILPPDSEAVRAAMRICKDASAPYLFNHCLRAYFWARLLDDGTTPFDDEATFVAVLLHDLGLTESHRLKSGKDRCFTIVGARAAEALAREHHWDDHRVRLAAQAITLHINVLVDDAHGREAQLVRIGSGADVAGLGLHSLHPEQIGAVCRKFPRLDMTPAILNDLDLERRERPNCRIAFMQDKLGFRELINNADFPA